MKKRILALSLVIILSLLLIGFTRSEAKTSQTFEKVNFISGVVTANELNFRTGPSTNNDIIGVFKKHKWVNVLAKIGDWYAVFDPETGKVGCVAGAYLVDANTVMQGKTPAPPSTATPAPQPPATQTPAPGQPSTSDDLTEEEKLLLELINNERAKSNLSPLNADSELMKVARLKAKDMTTANYFSHYSPTYGSPFDMMRQFGITFKAAAENIAGNSTVQGAVKAWMNSEGHRSNILNGNYNYTGVGVAKSNKYGYVFVQMFIKK
jgi:uncharacterized YkwD family protein